MEWVVTTANELMALGTLTIIYIGLTVPGIFIVAAE